MKKNQWVTFLLGTKQETYKSSSKTLYNSCQYAHTQRQNSNRSFCSSMVSHKKIQQAAEYKLPEREPFLHQGPAACPLMAGGKAGSPSASLHQGTAESPSAENAVYFCQPKSIKPSEPTVLEVANSGLFSEFKSSNIDVKMTSSKLHPSSLRKMVPLKNGNTQTECLLAQAHACSSRHTFCTLKILVHGCDQIWPAQHLYHISSHWNFFIFICYKRNKNKQSPCTDHSYLGTFLTTLTPPTNRWHYMEFQWLTSIAAPAVSQPYFVRCRMWVSCWNKLCFPSRCCSTKLSVCTEDGVLWLAVTGIDDHRGHVELRHRIQIKLERMS